MRNMRPITLLLLPLLCWGASNSGLDSAVDRARSLPGEFAADGLIRLAGVPDLPAAKRIELLKEAFQRAAEAQEPMRRYAAITRITGPAGYMNRAYAQEMDRMSLRMRAIEVMLPLDAPKARQMFLDIPALAIPRLSCTDFLVYDVSRYYTVLGTIGGHEVLKIVEPRIQEIASASQIEPAARMILALGATNDDFAAVVAALGGVLRRISGDDRAFTAAAALTGPAILDLAEECHKRKLSPIPLLEAYRTFLVANLSGPRCADNDLILSSQNAGGSQGPEGFFNDHLAQPPVIAIAPAEAAASKIDGAAEGLRGCEENECKALAARFRDLIMNPAGTALTPAQKTTPEWEEQLRQFLAAMDAWKAPDSADAARVYSEKAGIYEDLVAAAPPGGRPQEMVVQATLDFVRQGQFQARNRIEWFLPINALIGRMELEPRGIGRLLPLLRAANDPVISFYADLDALAPRGPAPLMSLL